MAFVLIPAKLTPSGVGIGRTDSYLAAFSGCCGDRLNLGPIDSTASVNDFAARGWYCANCGELKSRCRRARATDVARSATHLQEWVADWTGWAYSELHVEKS